MKHPTLFETPITHPSRRRKFRAFKQEHGIVTHYCGAMPKEDHPWLACLIEQCRKFGYGVTEHSDLFDIVAKVGRLAEEADLLVTGRSERDAVRYLCKVNNFPTPP